MEVGITMTKSNLKNFDNFYADLAQSAYTGRPSNFPPDNNSKDYQLFDFSQDAKFYIRIQKSGKSLLEVKTLIRMTRLMARSTCSQILICIL